MNLGERFLNRNGYYEIYSPNHPAQHDGYILEHRYIMECHLKRYLSRDETVHHINEIKTDNRIKNLYLCSALEHKEIHERKHGGKRERGKYKKVG
jgi:hypothetical protein